MRGRRPQADNAWMPPARKKILKMDDIGEFPIGITEKL